MQFKENGNRQAEALPDGLLYIAEDNYFFTQVDSTSPYKYLYTDGATSCIIMILSGTGELGREMAAMCHLSCRPLFDLFFHEMIPRFSGPVSLWATGANPPGNKSARDNIGKLAAYLYSLEKNSSLNIDWYLDTITLKLGTGDPREANRDCLGIDLEKKIITNQRLLFTPELRDPTSGIITLYHFFGIEVGANDLLRVAGTPFPASLVKDLVESAKQAEWTRVLEMSNNEILQNYSSTPECESPWFVANIKKSALFVKNFIAGGDCQ